MCGIFGCKNFNTDRDIIQAGLIHRGPDSFNHLKIDDWTYYHCRLSIIDLSEKAKQPMTSDGNMIIFNGEIYNYKELKKEYLNDCSFNSMSDTEVLLKLIQIYGFKILNKLNGMYAFAYYDKKSQSTYLVRDRYGVKPLYYYQNGNSFAFCSEDAVLMKVLNIPFKFNDKYLFDLLNKNMSDFDENSIINNIFSVKAGEYIEVTKDNKIIKRKYYNYDDYKIQFMNNKNNLVDCFEELLTDSIRIRNRSDCPIALTLSGGVDSSVIYTIAKERLGLDYTIFTYSNDNYLDEFNNAKKLAQIYGDKIIKVAYNETKFLDNYEKSIIALNGPIWSCAHAGYYELYKQIKNNGFKVVIEGHGSDEIFGGWQFLFPIASKQALLQKKYQLAFDILLLYMETNKISIKKKNITDIIKYLFKKNYINKHIFDDILNYIFTQKILPINLRCWDRLSMANSIESRSPFLDYRIIEFTRNLDLKYKINKIGNKAILREILKKYKKDFIYKNKIKQPFLASEIDFLKRNSNKMIEYYDNNKYNFDISNWINQDFSMGYNPKIYKICALGFLEDYYKKSH